MTQFSMLEQMQQQSAGQVEGQRGRLPGQDGLLAGRQGPVRPGRRRADRLHRQGAHPHRRRPCRREGRRSQRRRMTPLSHNPALVPPGRRTGSRRSGDGAAHRWRHGAQRPVLRRRPRREGGRSPAQRSCQGAHRAPRDLTGSRDPRPPAERRRPRRCQGLTGVRRPRGRRGLRRVRQGQDRHHRGRSRLHARSRLHQHRFRSFLLTTNPPLPAGPHRGSRKFPKGITSHDARHVLRHQRTAQPPDHA